MDWDKAFNELGKKLNPVNVQPPAQGKYGDYLFAWHVINEANRIFGYDGWSYTIDLQKVSESTNNNSNHVIGYICKCTLTVDGVTRQDVGYGEGIAKNIGDAHEGATKEAATDALKRALRTFGNQFGLALYDKSQQNVGVDIGDNEISDAVSAIEALKSMDDLENHFGNLYRNFKAIATNKDVVAAKDKRKGELTSDPSLKDDAKFLEGK